MSSLQARLWLTYALVIGVVLCVVTLGLVIYLLRNPVIDRQAYLNLERVAEIIFNRPELIDALQRRPGEVIERIDALVSVRALVLGADGSLIADSREQSATAFGPIVRRFLSQARGVLRDQDGVAWLQVTRSLPNGSRLVLVTPRVGGRNLLTSQALREVLRDDLLPPLARAGGIALLVALALSFWIARWVSAPLQRMASATQQVAEERYQELPLDGPDEVRELAQAFNEMVARVQSSQQSQRDFIANVSHELKTPLTSIQGFAQAILDGAVDTPQGNQEAARVIHAEAGRMHRLVLDLLDLARFDAGTVNIERAPVELAGILRHVVERFNPMSEQLSVEINLQVASDLEILGDADRLTQVFNNLTENALKFSPAGGKVWLNARREGGWAVISVNDNGTGIPPEELPRIFERFYQTDKSRRGGSGRGVGLGLAIAHEIVEAHAGSIAASNNSPQGTIFVVKLPLLAK